MSNNCRPIDASPKTTIEQKPIPFGLPYEKASGNFLRRRAIEEVRHYKYSRTSFDVELQPPIRWISHHFRVIFHSNEKQWNHLLNDYSDRLNTNYISNMTTISHYSIIYHLKLPIVFHRLKNKTEHLSLKLFVFKLMSINRIICL